jgi:hypothetical protein
MKTLILLSFLMVLSGCGMDDQRPQDFQGVYSCTIEGGTFESELNVDCDKVRRNLALAKVRVQRLGYEWKFNNLRIKHWDRQFLSCVQYFLGFCVYPIKGLSSGSIKTAGSLQMIDLNNGGELLLHELLHYLVDDPDHVQWPWNGFRKADQDFRRDAELLIKPVI